MPPEEGWAAYARQSYGLQWANGERMKHTTTRRAPSVRALMRPSTVHTSWPNGWLSGWHTDIPTRW